MLDDTKIYAEGDTQVSARDLNTFGQLVRIIREISGADLIVDSSGIHFRRGRLPVKPIRIKITGATQDGTNKRWKYDWVEVVKSTAGYGGWATLTGGRTGHGTDYDYAYNSVEDMNAATGLYGNGVNSSNLTGTLAVQPVPTNVIVRAWLEYPADGSKPEPWFAYENGVDGGC